MSKEQNVNTPCAAYSKVSPKWDLLRDLRAGTQAMREAGRTWLPPEPAESNAAYESRVNRSFLLNAYDDTVTKLSSKPFTKPITLKEAEALDDRLLYLEIDAEDEDASLTQFARQLFDTAVDRGLTFILTDFPDMREASTHADEKTARPRFVEIRPDDLISWTFDGDTLTEIRVRETITEPDGAWSDTEVPHVRVLRPNEWLLFKKVEDEWIQVDSGTFSLGFIPLTPVYFNKKGRFVADPPLIDLAWKNLEHWQSSSDQRNILRFARFGLLFAKGFSSEEFEKKIEIGPNRMIKTVSPDADLKYVEHTGAAISAGERDLKAIEEQMTMLGLQPLVAKSGTQTATGESIDEARAHSEIQSWVRSLESGLRSAYANAAAWIQTELPEGFAVDIYSDFIVSQRMSQDITSLLTARKQGEITRPTFLHELKRRGMLADTVVVENEIEELEKEDERRMAFMAPFEDEEEESDDG
jgi:hypothetical protein